MIHFLPIAAAEPCGDGSEALTRLASMRRALRLVDPWGGGPADDLSDEEVAAAWSGADEGTRRCFASRSERTVGGATAGLETLVAVRECGRDAPAEAVGQVADFLREGLKDIAELLRR